MKSKLETIRELTLRGIFRAEKDTDKNTRAYWNMRWFLNLQHDRVTPELRTQMVSAVTCLLEQHKCENVLEVGCGAFAPLRGLDNATHLDYSLKALRRSKLGSFIYADITAHIPVPDKTFDATYSSNCLIHIPNNSIASACAEIKRVTKKVVILNEGNDSRVAKYFDGLVCKHLLKQDVKSQ